MKSLIPTVVILLASWEMVFAQQCPAACLQEIQRVKELKSNCGSEWKLLFSAKSGTGEMVLDAWEGDQDVNPGNPNAPVFKSPLAEEWEKRQVEQVRIEVVTGGAVVAYFIFDGRGTTKTNFMSKDRIIASSNGDLAGEKFNYFSVNGDHYRNRHFFINAKYGGCPADVSWLVVVDSGKTVFCDWSTKNGARPLFLYCKGAGSCLNDDALKGDTFRILVKFA